MFVACVGVYVACSVCIRLVYLCRITGRVCVCAVVCVSKICEAYCVRVLCCAWRVSVALYLYRMCAWLERVVCAILTDVLELKQ